MQITVDDIRMLLMRWAKLNRGKELPKGYGNTFYTPGGGGDDGEWPADVQMLEIAMTNLYNSCDEGKKMLAALKVEYLPTYSKTLEVKAKELKIRKQDYRFYVDTSERYLLDIYNKLTSGTENAINSGRIGVAA